MPEAKHWPFPDRVFEPPIPIRVISRNLIELEKSYPDTGGAWPGPPDLPQLIVLDLNEIVSIETTMFHGRDFDFIPNLLTLGLKNASQRVFADKEHLTRLWAEYLAQKVYVKLEDLKHSIIQAE